MRYALILAGGSGTRLWPLSREGLPKQLIPVLEGRSLLEEAYLRLEGVVPAQRRLVCAAERHRGAVLERVPGLAAEGPGLSGPGSPGLGRYVGEPEGRDTLAALALSCALIVREDPEAVVGVFTSDHVIRPREAFRAAVESAFALVELSPWLLVTFGVPPTRPSTAFGYLELGFDFEDAKGGPARQVLRFREKPDEATAVSFVAAGPGRYLWNSGMFAWRADRFLELVERFEPELRAGVSRIASFAGTPAYPGVLASVYPSLKKTSVDFGIMEPASRAPGVEIAALPLDLEWLDIGSWQAYAELLPKDESLNASSGAAALVDCSGSVVISAQEGHLVACLGCEDLVVVHAADATLVCPRSRADELKRLYSAVSGLEGGRFR